MDDALTRLKDCLDEQTEAAGRLLERLCAEATALSTSDAGTLEQALAPKQAALAELAALEPERERLARAAGAPESGLADWLASHTSPLHAEVHARWRRLLEVTAECRRQNQANGAMIQAGLRHGHQIIALLGGRSPEEATTRPYGPGGAPGDARAGAGHSLGKA